MTSLHWWQSLLDSYNSPDLGPIVTELQTITRIAIPQSDTQVIIHNDDNIRIIGQKAQIDAKVDLDFNFRDKKLNFNCLWLPVEQRASGIAKTFFRALVPFCKKWNIPTISMEAHWIGRYTWARFGFNCSPQILKLKKDFLKILYLGNAQSPISKIKHIAEIAAAKLQITLDYINAIKRKRTHKPMWQLLLQHINDTTTPFWHNGDFLIGKWSLLGGDPMNNNNNVDYPIPMNSIERWYGNITLNDQFAKTLLYSYIGLSEDNSTPDIDDDLQKIMHQLADPISIPVTQDLLPDN